MGLCNSDAKLTASFREAIVDVVGCVVVAAAIRIAFWSHVGHDPLLGTQVDCFLDWEPTHYLLVDVDDLVLFEDHRLWKNRLVVQIDRVALDRQVPIAEDLLAHEQAN